MVEALFQIHLKQRGGQVTTLQLHQVVPMKSKDFKYFVKTEAYYGSDV